MNNKDQLKLRYPQYSYLIENTDDFGIPSYEELVSFIRDDLKSTFKGSHSLPKVIREGNGRSLTVSIDFVNIEIDYDDSDGDIEVVYKIRKLPSARFRRRIPDRDGAILFAMFISNLSCILTLANDIYVENQAVNSRRIFHSRIDDIFILAYNVFGDVKSKTRSKFLRSSNGQEVVHLFSTFYYKDGIDVSVLPYDKITKLVIETKMATIGSSGKEYGINISFANEKSKFKGKFPTGLYKKSFSHSVGYKDFYNSYYDDVFRLLKKSGIMDV